MSHSAHKLTVIGAGPGDRGSLTAAAGKALREASCVVAAERHMPLVENKSEVIPLKKFEETFALMRTRLSSGDVAVLVSGDTGVYSLLPLLKKRFADVPMTVLPGISSIQSLCAMLKETWIDARILSGHGRPLPAHRLLHTVCFNRKTIVFCGPDCMPREIARILAQSGLRSLSFSVGERMGYPEGRLVTLPPAEAAMQNFDALSLVFIENTAPATPPHIRPRDDEFIRTSVPMTREVVRSAVLDTLHLTPESVLWDLGAGTGSISVAASLECGTVHAVERKHEACELIRKNAAEFHSYNLTVHEGGNLDTISSLPVPTHVFIGGSGKELPMLLEQISKLPAGVRIVISAVALKTVTAAYETLTHPPFENFDAYTVAVTRGKHLASTYVMTAQNPVTVFSADIKK